MINFSTLLYIDYMSSDSDTNDKELTIFELYTNDSIVVYHVVSESNMKTRARLFKNQYKEYEEGKVCRKC